MKKVSIITPCYNSEKYIGRYLNSILWIGNCIKVNLGGKNRREDKDKWITIRIYIMREVYEAIS